MGDTNGVLIRNGTNYIINRQQIQGQSNQHLRQRLSFGCWQQEGYAQSTYAQPRQPLENGFTQMMIKERDITALEFRNVAI